MVHTTTHNTALKEVSNANNELWNHVSYVREAVLDGDTLELISSRATKQLATLDDGARYEALDVARKLRQKCGLANGQFDWTLLGQEAGACFNTVPCGITFFQGPIDDAYVPKERKVRPRHVEQEDDVEEEKPQVANTQGAVAKDADKLSMVEKHIKTIDKTLKRKAKAQCESTLSKLDQLQQGDALDDVDQSKKDRLQKRGVEPICAVQCLFNPQSFTQTVENIFHFSFLVKQGSAAIQVPKRNTGAEDDNEEHSDCDYGPKICPKAQRTQMPISRQAIVSLNMADWRNMCDAYGVHESDVPHRTGSKHEKPQNANANAKAKAKSAQKSKSKRSRSS
jgi:hypothetical protein